MTIDPRTFRLVAGMLGIAFIVIVISMALLAGFGKDYPGVFDNILTGLLTGLLGLLISARSEEPVDVTVTNPPADPVPTADVPAKRSRSRRTDRGEGLVVALVVILLVAIIVSFIIR